MDLLLGRAVHGVGLRGILNITGLGELGRVGSGDHTRPDPRVLTRPMNSPAFFYTGTESPIHKWNERWMTTIPGRFYRSIFHSTSNS